MNLSTQIGRRFLLLAVAFAALCLGPNLAPNLAMAAPTAATPIGGLGNSPFVAMLFWAFAFLTLGGAVFVITRSNLVVAVMGMVGTFFCIAVLYAMLYAHFMAVIQVLVYAGAIMVLFVFVIMILNRAEPEPWALEGLFGKAVAGGALFYLFIRLSQVLWAVQESAPAITKALDGIGMSGGKYEWGGTRALGKVLFTDYLFPFEAVSLVLLVAVVGAVAVARPSVTEPGAEEKPHPGGTHPAGAKVGSSVEKGEAS